MNETPSQAKDAPSPPVKRGWLGGEVNPNAPIGVFDSGLGGLTVVRKMREMLPGERILYVADQAHVPYGGRELAEVGGFAGAISDALFAAGCKAVVMACNISSAVALDAVRERYAGQPVLGVIAPGAKAAAAQTANGRIGVLATEGTARSGAYERALLAIDPALHIVTVACPDFVPLVESNRTHSPEAFEAARRYLTPLCNDGVDTVVLGCTHYPFLFPTLRDLAPALQFVDPAAQTVRELCEQLQRCGLRHSSEAAETHLMTTGDAEAFTVQVHAFLPDGESVGITLSHWRDGQLDLMVK